jgi:hypothetical protein
MNVIIYVFHSNCDIHVITMFYVFYSYCDNHDCMYVMIYLLFHLVIYVNVIP